MNITGPSKSGDIKNQIQFANNTIAEFIQTLYDQADSSVAGSQPEDNKSYYDDKDRREVLGRLLVTFENSDTEFDNLDTYLKVQCKDLQELPIAAPIVEFIKKEFGIQIEPLNGPTREYQRSIEFWSDEFGVAEKKLKRVMPFAKFRKLTADRVDDIMEKRFG